MSGPFFDETPVIPTGSAVPKAGDAVASPSGRLAFPVVGVAAAAGGIEAFSALLGAMPADSGVAIVFVGHASPRSKPVDADVLQALARMPVRFVDGDTELAADHVYLVRPGQTATLIDGRLRLGTSTAKRVRKSPIDAFFQYLASAQREQAACIVLSGAGTHGTAGARAIQAAGGLCIAQDPDSAATPSMPRNLIAAGLASWVLRPAEMPAVLLRHAIRHHTTDLHRVLDVIDEGFCVLELLYENDRPVDGRIMDVNPGLERETGLANVVGRRIRELASDSGQDLFDLCDRTLQTGLPTRADRPVAAFGRRFDVHAVPVGPANKRNVAVLISDIDSGRPGQGRFRKMLEALPHMVWQVDPAGVLLWHNRRWTDYTGQATGQARDGGWLAMVHPDDRDAARAGFERALRSGEPWTHEHRILSSSKFEYRWFLSEAVPQRDADGRVVSWVGSVIDIHDRRNTIDELAESEGQLRSLLESARDFAVLLMDEHGVITRWNAGATQILGWTEEEAVGLPGAMIFTDEDRATNQPEKEIATALKNGRAPDERWHQRRDGSRFWGSGVMSPVRDNGGAHRGFVKILRDMTERRRAEAERATLLDAEMHARTAAEAANASKDLFLANLSHELRTPLAAMLMWLKVLQEQSDSSVVSEGLAALEHSANAQQKLIDDLLDSARITTGKLSLELKPVDLGQVIRQAVATLRHTIDARGLEVQIDIGRSVGVVMADAERLQQVVWNLLNNAVKFTPTGGRVTVGLWRRDSTVEIRVADTGQGIDPDLLPNIFGRFQQGDPSRTRRVGGLGLGLSISRQIVELHGGTIQAASPGPGKGSVFTVYLPLLRARAVRREMPVRSDLAGVRIVLIEDDAQLRDVVTMVLQRAGATVVTFGMADPAKPSLLATPPDVLLCDIGLPDKDGYTFVRELRESEPAGARVPAIAFTAFDRPQDRAHALKSGFDEHLSKPVDPTRLVQTVRAVLQSPRD